MGISTFPSHAGVDAFLAKLRHGATLSQRDQQVLVDLAGTARRFDRRQDVVAGDERPPGLPLIQQGWAYRYRLLRDGKRQIVALYLPGDLCEPFGALPSFQDFPLGTLTSAGISFIDFRKLQRASESSTAISQALWWDLLVNSEITHEHVVSLGRRSATQRLGHLFCELQVRLAMVGLDARGGYDLPLTQADLGDLLGLSAVHVNRSLKELRQSGLITFREGRLTIHNLEELREASMFDAVYLQLPDNSKA